MTMTREEKLARLRKNFGMPEQSSWDPETFLLQLGIAIKANTDIVKTSVETLNKSAVDKDDVLRKMQEIAEINKTMKEMIVLHRELTKAVTEHRIEKVEVEHIREIPPSKFKVEVEQIQGELPKEHKNFFTALFTGAIKAPIDQLTSWFQQTLDFIRKPEGAIAVRLVDKDGKHFYNAMFSAISGGVGISMQTVEAYLLTISSWQTNAGSVTTNVLRIAHGYDTSWLSFRANYTAAQTNTAIVTASSGQRIIVKKISVMADKANTVDVAVLIGFHASTTPTGADVVLTHPGIAAGSGVIENSAPDSVVSQANGDDLRITSEVPTTGSIDVLVVYKLI